jgi:hypothetical protein
MDVAKRRGSKRAKVAVARKIGPGSLPVNARECGVGQRLVDSLFDEVGSGVGDAAGQRVFLDGRRTDVRR